jgi:hypothetical protein
MRRLTASGTLCNGICRVPKACQRFRSERTRTGNRLKWPCHRLLPVRSSILALVGGGQGRPFQSVSYGALEGYCNHPLRRNSNAASAPCRFGTQAHRGRAPRFFGCGCRLEKSRESARNPATPMLGCSPSPVSASDPSLRHSSNASHGTRG